MHTMIFRDMQGGTIGSAERLLTDNEELEYLQPKTLEIIFRRKILFVYFFSIQRDSIYDPIQRRQSRPTIRNNTRRAIMVYMFIQLQVNNASKTL